MLGFFIASAYLLWVLSKTKDGCSKEELWTFIVLGVMVGLTSGWLFKHGNIYAILLD